MTSLAAAAAAAAGGLLQRSRRCMPAELCGRSCHLLLNGALLMYSVAHAPLASPRPGAKSQAFSTLTLTSFRNSSNESRKCSAKHNSEDVRPDID